MNISVTPLSLPAPASLPFEIVERKGVGHPDTICDALAEAFGRGLCRFYQETFGRILHHNVDKALRCGGMARPAFRGGEMVEPIEIHLAGRATCKHRGAEIPVQDIAIESCRRWLRENLSHLDADAHVRVVPHIRSTSSDLSELFDRTHTPGASLANDTSFGVGYAPLDILERTVLAVAHDLNAPNTRSMHPFIGEDIKVMGARHGSDIELTVACALVGCHVESLDDYRAKKRAIGARALEVSRKVGDAPVSVAVNAADHDTPDGIYLTVTGLSAEAGDDGQVGRGNRVNGLITPYRPMSLEAAAGKNPVTHVGKLYNVMAHRIAHAIVSEVPEIEETYCYLLSRIGHPVADPALFDVKVRLEELSRLTELTPQITDVAHATFSRIDSLQRDALNGSLQLW
jgi:S-adenosylmethionine synthetase